MINLKLAISNKSSSSQTNRQQTHSPYATQTPQPTLRVNEGTVSSLHVLVGCATSSATSTSNYVVAHLACQFVVRGVRNPTKFMIVLKCFISSLSIVPCPLFSCFWPTPFVDFSTYPWIFLYRTGNSLTGFTSDCNHPWNMPLYLRMGELHGSRATYSLPSLPTGAVALIFETTNSLWDFCIYHF